MSRIIIDGYNLLHCANLDIPFSLDLEGQRETLLRILHNYAAKQGCTITVVFDNRQMAPGTQTPDKLLKVIFSPPAKEADEVIRRIIRNSKSPQKLTLVSSDRAIQFTAKSHGVTVLKSQEFGRMLEKSAATDSNAPAFRQTSAKYDPDLSDADISEWKSLFENNDDED